MRILIVDQDHHHDHLPTRRASPDPTRISRDPSATADRQATTRGGPAPCPLPPLSR